MRKSKWLKLEVVLASLLLVVGIGVYASAHGGKKKLVHGCINNKTKLVRIVGASKKCRSNESARDWNKAGRRGRRGPIGPVGPQGPQGAQGETGLQGPPGEDGTFTTSGFHLHPACVNNVSGAVSLIGHGNKSACAAITETEVTIAVQDHPQ